MAPPGGYGEGYKTASHFDEQDHCREQEVQHNNGRCDGSGAKPLEAKVKAVIAMDATKETNK